MKKFLTIFVMLFLLSCDRHNESIKSKDMSNLTIINSKKPTLDVVSRSDNDHSCNGTFVTIDVPAGVSGWVSVDVLEMSDCVRESRQVFDGSLVFIKDSGDVTIKHRNDMTTNLEHNRLSYSIPEVFTTNYLNGRDFNEHISGLVYISSSKGGVLRIELNTPMGCESPEGYGCTDGECLPWDSNEGTPFKTKLALTYNNSRFEIANEVKFKCTAGITFY